MHCSRTQLKSTNPEMWKTLGLLRDGSPELSWGSLGTGGKSWNAPTVLNQGWEGKKESFQLHSWVSCSLIFPFWPSYFLCIYLFILMQHKQVKSVLYFSPHLLQEILMTDTEILVLSPHFRHSLTAVEIQFCLWKSEIL